MTARAVSTNTPLRCPRKTPHVTKGESFRLDDNDSWISCTMRSLFSARYWNRPTTFRHPVVHRVRTDAGTRITCCIHSRAARAAAPPFGVGNDATAGQTPGSITTSCVPSGIELDSASRSVSDNKSSTSHAIWVTRETSAPAASRPASTV